MRGALLQRLGYTGQLLGSLPLSLLTLLPRGRSCRNFTP